MTAKLIRSLAPRIRPALRALDGMPRPGTAAARPAAPAARPADPAARPLRNSRLVVMGPPFSASPPGYLDSQVETAADARRQRVKLYSEYCEPFATEQMRPDRLARRVK